MDSREEYQRNRERYYKELFEASGGCCFNCQVSDGEFHVHHIVPLADGGTNNRLNLSLLCLECHGKVHQKDFLKMSELSKKARMDKIEKPHLPPDNELVPMLMKRVLNSWADKSSIAKIKKDIHKNFYVSTKEKKRLNHAIRFVSRARFYSVLLSGDSTEAWELFKKGDYVNYLQCTKREFSINEIPLSLREQIS